MSQGLHRTANIKAYYAGNRRALPSLLYIPVSNFHLFLPRTLRSGSFLIKSNLYKIHHVFVPNFHDAEAVVTIWMVIFILLPTYSKTVIQIWNTFIHQRQPTVSSGNARACYVMTDGLWYFVNLYQLCFIVNTAPPAVTSCWVTVITVAFKWYVFCSIFFWYWFWCRLSSLCLFVFSPLTIPV